MKHDISTCTVNQEITSQESVISPLKWFYFEDESCVYHLSNVLEPLSAVMMGWWMWERWFRERPARCFILHWDEMSHARRGWVPATLLTCPIFPELLGLLQKEDDVRNDMPGPSALGQIWSAGYQRVSCPQSPTLSAPSLEQKFTLHSI